jgi:hypothetical protein
MTTITSIACAVVAVLIAARLRWLVKVLGWRRIGSEIRRGF